MENQKDYSDFNLFPMNSDSWLTDFVQPSDTLMFPSDCWNTEHLPNIRWETAEPGDLPTLDDVSESIIPSTEAFNFHTNTSFPNEAEQQSQIVYSFHKAVALHPYNTSECKPNPVILRVALILVMKVSFSPLEMAL